MVLTIEIKEWNKNIYKHSDLKINSESKLFTGAEISLFLLNVRIIQPTSNNIWINHLPIKYYAMPLTSYYDSNVCYALWKDKNKNLKISPLSIPLNLKGGV